MARIGTWLAGRARAAKQDPRDVRIRSLEAERRVAQSSNEKLKSELEEHKKALVEVKTVLAERDGTTAEQQRVIQRLREDLKDSVRKTRELRTDLTERATESVRFEVRVRELETELSVAHSSPSLLALDYGNDEPDSEETPAKRRVSP